MSEQRRYLAMDVRKPNHLQASIARFATKENPQNFLAYLAHLDFTALHDLPSLSSPLQNID